MRFGPRNAYYLRISEHTVLPLYLYLDERHVDWMSEQVLQHVLSDLRPKILPKLKEEANARLGLGGPANAKRGTVDVHRGETYQFAYFLAETKQHSVLIKTRNFVPAPAPPPGALPPPRPSRLPRRPEGQEAARAPRKRRHRQGQQRARESDEDEAINISSDEDDRPPAAEPRRSARARRVVAGAYRDQNEDEDIEEVVEVHDVDADVDVTTASGNPPAETAEPATSAVQLDDSGLIAMDEAEDTPAPRLSGSEPVEDIIADQITATPPTGQAEVQSSLPHVEEEDEKKLVLRLNYEGFNIQGRHLCVVVEPYPPIRASTRAPSLAPVFTNTQRAPSIAPPDFVPSGDARRREKTPLFLPEYDRERSVTPAPAFTRHRTLPPVPLFTDNPEDSDSDDGGFMEFTQVLRSAGQNQAGAMEDDDEIEGAVFFGDADETKELG
ncbi:uncharacterized protein B0H18DRAFT_1091036 [Fomitopsis serialis]|uniref:uncharacterized protein n=1 Tax=Fomitopsis serialis TaxID=139415 RepID=UPI002007A5BB|nr:uncharacterized protein B0H18DRAFT_1091036 [Neoantrodia serialis]KAH9938212.1 hypothetical protein B0H18DRAFT_1091036 [Neoantrodia serialis]